MKTPLLLSLLGILGALSLASCSTASSSAPLRTNAGVSIYAPPGDVGAPGPAAPC